MHIGHDHPHAHGEAHDPHAPQRDHDDTLDYYRKLEIAVRELLIEKNVLSADEIRRTVESYDSRTPEGGARVVARAWVDPAFKALLLQDATAACESLGFDMNVFDVKLTVVENTPKVHNVIVCTLCSCYPWPVLGLPPTWYKSAPYRARVVAEPRAVLGEFGVELPDDVEVRVWDSTAEVRYLVLPMRPAGTDGLDEEALAALVTRDSMIGTGLPLAPAAA